MNTVYIYIYIYYTYIPIYQYFSCLHSLCSCSATHSTYIPLSILSNFFLVQPSRRNIINVIPHVTILTDFQFNHSGLENMWTEAVGFFPICTIKTTELGLGRESDVGGWTAIKKMMTRETRLYMSFTPLNKFHTLHLHAKRAENSHIIIAEKESGVKHILNYK